jgi:hypothetical protein
MRGSIGATCRLSAPHLLDVGAASAHMHIVAVARKLDQHVVAGYMFPEDGEW